MANLPRKVSAPLILATLCQLPPGDFSSNSSSASPYAVNFPEIEPDELYREEAARFIEGAIDSLGERDYSFLDSYSRFTGRNISDVWRTSRRLLAEGFVNALLPLDEERAPGEPGILEEERSGKIFELMATYDILLERAPRVPASSYQEAFRSREELETFFKLEKHALYLAYELFPEGVEGEKIIGSLESYQRSVLENFPG